MESEFLFSSHNLPQHLFLIGQWEYRKTRKTKHIDNDHHIDRRRPSTLCGFVVVLPLLEHRNVD